MNNIFWDKVLTTWITLAMFSLVLFEIHKWLAIIIVPFIGAYYIQKYFEEE